MDLWKILLVSMFASGFAVVASFQVENDLSHQNVEDGSTSNECSFCYYYFETGHGPYEVLWKLGLETRSRMTLRSQVLMLMDPGHLKLAQYFFHDYCQQICGKTDRGFRRGSSVALPCQNENENVDYEY